MLEEIIKELENSDIIWGRYGSDTIEDLAVRILRIVEKKMMPQVGDKIVVTGKHLNLALEARNNKGYSICEDCMVAQALREKYDDVFTYAYGDITYHDSDISSSAWYTDNDSLDQQFDNARTEQDIELLRNSLPKVLTIVRERE